MNWCLTLIDSGVELFHLLFITLILLDGTGLMDKETQCLLLTYLMRCVNSMMWRIRGSENIND